MHLIYRDSYHQYKVDDIPDDISVYMFIENIEKYCQEIDQNAINNHRNVLYLNGAPIMAGSENYYRPMREICAIQSETDVIYLMLVRSVRGCP